MKICKHNINWDFYILKKKNVQISDKTFKIIFCFLIKFLLLTTKPTHLATRFIYRLKGRFFFASV